MISLLPGQITVHCSLPTQIFDSTSRDFEPPLFLHLFFLQKIGITYFMYKIEHDFGSLPSYISLSRRFPSLKSSGFPILTWQD